MGYDDNNNQQNQQQQQQQQNVNTPLNTGYQTPNYISGPAVNDGFSLGPNAYQYMPIVNNNANVNNNNNANNGSNNNMGVYYGYPGQFQPGPPPPGFVYQQYVPANGAIITTATVHSSSNNHGSDSSLDEHSTENCKRRGYFHAEEVTGALIIFLCGFFLTCIWLAGCIYFKSKNSTARALGILSVILFTVFTIISVVLISIIFTQAGNTDNNSSSGCRVSESPLVFESLLLDFQILHQYPLYTFCQGILLDFSCQRKIKTIK
ncbi:hypothetical protein PPL_11942 [Heterostelium album PN500]|uniref:Uncharacterized protein n=1 Tax=Heterostelium pallidum (strain ATCC 26659 / Pp 5 / PN500) TaxID=670386 RepID=D3BUX0_HETP5|nr:hypothetical protein PPL_11942 [Heterostelium album PN500]EFA74908.1 hypothetical protein PPL_11942 [Heterostelium album PN500]|eukprot:XP_020427042.1 hypothetical protein PPL_11942 [Heterostelium album PN500]